MSINGLKVLIFEDDPLDIQLNINELSKEYPDATIQSTDKEKEFKSLIDSFKPDIVLSDYNLPGFDGLDALNYIRENYPLLPIVVVTGSLDEETAANCIKKGAWDYVLKEHIFRLNPAISLAIKHRDERIKLKDIEEKILESEAISKRLVNNIETGILLLNLNLEVVFSNVKAESILLISGDKLQGRKIYEELKLTRARSGLKIESNEDFIEDLDQFHTTRNDIELIYYPEQQNSRKWLSLSLTPLHDKQGKLDEILVCFDDISEKKVIESELLDSKSRYEVIFNSVNDGIFIYDSDDFTLIDVNEAVIRMYKYNKEEIFNKSIGDLSDSENGYTTELARENARKAAKGEFTASEWLAKDKTGRTFWVYVMLKVLTIGHQRVLMAIVRDIDLQKRTRDSLKKSQEHFRALTENSPDVIMRFDKQHRHLFVNKAVEDLTGIAVEEFMNKTHREMGLFSDEDCAFWEDKITKVFETGKLLTTEFSIETDNAERELEWRLFPEFDSNMNVEGVVAVTRDITESKEYERKLKESEQMLQIVLDNIPQSIFWKDKNSVYLGCNKAFADSAGLKDPSDIAGKTDYDLPWKDSETEFFREVDRRVMDNDMPEYNIVESRRFASSEETWNNTNKVPLHNLEGDVIGILGTADNITEKKEAQEALRASEERLQIALEGTSDGLWDWNIPENSFYFSPRYFTMLGYEPQDLSQDKNILEDLLHPEDKQRVLEALKKILENKEDNLDLEFRLIKKDGSIAWILSRGKISYDEKGNALRLVGTHVDISLRKRHEKVQNVLIEIANSVNNTRNLNELFEQIQKSLGNVIDTRNCYIAMYDKENDTITLPYHKDEKDKFTEFPAGKTITGYVIKTGTSQLVNMDRVEQLEKTGEIEPIGSPSVSWLGVPLRIADDIIGVFVVQSYTDEILYTEDDVQLLEFVSDQIALAIERKIDQDKLRENELRQRRIIESSPDGLVVIDMNGYLVDWNSTFQEMMKFEGDNLSEKNFFDYVADEDVIKVQNILNETLSTSYSKNFEFIMKKASGARFYTETSFGLIHGNNEYQGSFVIVIKNIDERKQYEDNLKIAKEKAEESDRLKTAFLSNMSHEIRTPMNAIIGFAELLARLKTSNEEKTEYVRQINFAADTLMKLIDDIIDISKIEAGQLKMSSSLFKLDPLLSELKSMFGKSLERQNKSNIEFVIENHVDSDSIQLHADDFRLRQVFSNLLSNAIKFTNEGKICFGVKSLDKEKISFYVKDTGVGIDEMKQKYIFDRFRQGHENKEIFYGGTGLGLAISKNLLQLMGGDIKVKSKVNKGSEFIFTLPYDGKYIEIPDEKISINRGDTDWSGKTFLIAEDDPSNFYLLKENLKKFGVNILWAKNGKEAIEIFEKNSSDINLVLMDVQMPEVNGYEATRQIKKICPGVPVIAQTAYALAGERDASKEAGCDDYISKPLMMKELIFILNNFLDEEHVND
jgi:PAS domain S-box-containing protein